VFSVGAAGVVNVELAEVAYLDPAGYLRPAAVSALPTASATYRGQMLRVQGGNGVADVLYICTKDASDVYAWRTVTVT
jgi:hypothetical protein